MTLLPPEGPSATPPTSWRTTWSATPGPSSPYPRPSQPTRLALDTLRSSLGIPCISTEALTARCWTTSSSMSLFYTHPLCLFFSLDFCPKKLAVYFLVIPKFGAAKAQKLDFKFVLPPFDLKYSVTMLKVISFLFFSIWRYKTHYSLLTIFYNLV
jgi:hypothetical protein